MLNKRGLNIEPCGTPEVVSSQLLYDDPILVLFFQILKIILYDFLKKENTDCKHSIFLKLNHEIAVRRAPVFSSIYLSKKKKRKKDNVMDYSLF